MGKTITVASKFTEDEYAMIENYAIAHETSKSQVLHDFAIKGMMDKSETDKGFKTVGFYFLKDFAYFWKGRTYYGILHDGDVSIRFGGEWKNYKLADLPVEVI